MDSLAEAVAIADADEIFAAFPSDPSDAFRSLLIAIGKVGAVMEMQAPGVGVAWLRSLGRATEGLAEELPGMMRASRQ